MRRLKTNTEKALATTLLFKDTVVCNYGWSGSKLEANFYKNGQWQSRMGKKEFEETYGSWYKGMKDGHFIFPMCAADIRQKTRTANAY